MQRCLECDSLLAKNEKVCPVCGKVIGYGKRTIGEVIASAGRIIFYSSIAVLIVSRFVSAGSGFLFGLFLCTCALMFLMRSKKR